MAFLYVKLMVNDFFVVPAGLWQLLYWAQGSGKELLGYYIVLWR